MMLKNKLILIIILMIIIALCFMNSKKVEISEDQFNQMILEFAKKLEEQENGHKHQVDLINSRSRL